MIAVRTPGDEYDVQSDSSWFSYSILSYEYQIGLLRCSFTQSTVLCHTYACYVCINGTEEITTRLLLSRQPRNARLGNIV